MTSKHPHTAQKTDIKNVNKTKISPKPSTLRIGRRYRPTRVDSDYDAIVIGSGIGGMTTAAILSKAGKKVLVLEQHYTAGGYTHSYSRNGYEWDVGVHYIGEVGDPSSPLRKVFDFISDSKLHWAKMDDNYDRFHFGDDVYNLRAGRETFLNDLCARFPEESQAIERYLELLDNVSRLIPLQVMDKILPNILGQSYNFFKKLGLPDYLNKTTYEVLSKLTKDEKLIAVLTGQYGDCGLPPKQSSFLIHALIARHYLLGGYYPIGGAWKIADTIIPVIQQSGGDLLTYASVDEIVIKKGKAIGVKMADGHIIYSSKIISSAGVINTFKHLVPEETSRKHGYLEHLESISSSKAHLGMYIGLKGSPQELKLPKTNFWIFPEYDASKAFERFEANSQEEFPVVYISFPSAKDPEWQKNNPDKSTIEIVAPCPYEWFSKWKDQPWGKRDDDYNALKEHFTERMLEALYLKLPHLRGKIDYHETSTPLSTEFFCAYKKGELYGLEHNPKRFEQSWLRPKTTIPGLYLSGQDVLTCGVGGAMMGGLMASVSVLGWQSYKLLKEFGIMDSISLGIPTKHSTKLA
ncbi:MAG: all-trans-retinol 13,14-reductase [Oleiphilaceae bacterium]|jgi:all-trans-retinol 13,14-reductase